MTVRGLGAVLGFGLVFWTAVAVVAWAFAEFAMWLTRVLA